MTEKTPLWHAALVELLAGFSPAADAVSSSHQFSTDEIKSSIEKHTGEEVSRKELFDLLQQFGFKYHCNNDLQLEWLMRESR